MNSKYIYTIKNNNNYIKINNNIIGFKKYWSVLFTKYNVDLTSINNIKIIDSKLVMPKYKKELNNNNINIETLQFKDFLMIPFDDNIYIDEGIIILHEFQENQDNIILDIEKTIESL